MDTQPAQSMHQVQVHRLSLAEEGRWDAFVHTCPEASFFHRAGWQRALSEGLGHKTHYLYAEQDGAITGVYPLAEVKSRLFGHRLVSTPFCVYGGIAAITPEAHQALDRAGTTLAEELGVDYLELRSLRRQHPDWPCKDLYYTFRKPISGDEDADMKAIPRKQRAMVRKGIDAGLKAEIDGGIARFLHAYESSVRNLGTPIFPRRYFEILKQEFGEDCELMAITHEGQTVAGVMSFYFRDEVLPYYGGGTEAARELKGNDFLYWALMRHAGIKGVRLFDYGRSKAGTGAFSFKKNWGFDPQPLYHEFYLVKAKEMPDLNPLNPKYRLFIAAWQRMPLWLARLVGPYFSRYLG
ncbi:MAG: FemAB family PEP-CTERM system-associated protein [Gammaproteobacteria bacterium]|nr:FemAB family PEP-CTERM system-associated protein [Gammaproteobacteria bacterium]